MFVLNFLFDLVGECCCKNTLKQFLQKEDKERKLIIIGQDL